MTEENPQCETFVVQFNTNVWPMKTLQVNSGKNYQTI